MQNGRENNFGLNKHFFNSDGSRKDSKAYMTLDGWIFVTRHIPILESLFLLQDTNKLHNSASGFAFAS